MKLVILITEILCVGTPYTINVASSLDMLASVELNVLDTDLVKQYKDSLPMTDKNNQRIR
jgi:hypothetical protein